MNNQQSFKINYGIIKNYYKDLNSDCIINLIGKCKTNDQILDLLSTCTKHNIYLFKKNKKQWTIKETKQLFKECKSKKQTILRNFSDNVTQLSKDDTILHSDITQSLSDENNNVINNLHDIDKIINNICSVDFNDLKNTVFTKESNYIAEYSN